MEIVKRESFQEFNEIQTYHGFWLKLITALYSIFGLLLCYFYFRSTTPFESRHEAFQVFSVLWLTLGPILLLFAIMKLETKIDKIGVHVRFKPLMKTRTFPWSAIEFAYCKTYSPLMDFGGWGYRIGIMGQGHAYIVSGNVGLQLQLKNGKKRLIGTQQAKEIEDVLKLTTQKEV